MRVGEVASAGGVNEETLRCHVTNGDSAGNTLRQTALDGIVVAWRDMLPEGPLARVPAPDFRRLRARFLGDCGWGEPAAVEAEMQQRDQTFADALAAGHRIALWFEQDLLDQLQLLQVLVAIGEAGREADVELIVVDEAEGHPDFRGLGELAPTELEALWPARVPLTADIAKLAARAWDAVCAPDPTKLAALLDADTTALPLLAPAMARWLEELPDTTSGLALSERRVLDALADRPRTRQELFLGSMEGERLLLNGDAWFFRRLDELGDLVADVGADRVAITETGRRVLAGELDRVAVAGLDRWFGGTHLEPATAWRRDQSGLVPPRHRRAR